MVLHTVEGYYFEPDLTLTWRQGYTISKKEALQALLGVATVNCTISNIDYEI